MSRSSLALIALAALAGHALLFWVAAGKPWSPAPEPVPRQNFHSKTATLRDARTGETYRVREFTVSTRLAGPPPTPTPSAETPSDSR